MREGRWRVHSAVGIRHPSILISELSLDSSCESLERSARRGFPPRENNSLRSDPPAASAARAASEVNRPAASTALKSRIASPIATPPLGSPSGGLKTQNGGF